MAGLWGVVALAGEPGPERPSERLRVALAGRGSDTVSLPVAGGRLGACRWPWEDPGRGQIFERDGVALLCDARLDDRPYLTSQLGLAAAASTAEILWSAYRRWGLGCPDRLHGDFAFAVLDARRRRLLLVRDPFGIRPLCWTRLPHGLAFASEAAPLARLTGLDREHGEPELDPASVASFLCGETADPARTFFAGVHQVPPGQRVVIDAGGWRAERWWRPTMGGADAGTPAAEQAARLYLHLDRAVGDRSVDAGATVGVAMSGGLDSCSVAAIASRRHRQIGTARPMALSLVFRDFPECDESRYVSAMESELGIPVSRITADRLPLLPRTGLDPDTPFAPWSAAYDEMLARLRAAGGRVCLTGQGADDLLTGSPLVLAGRLQRGDLSVVGEIVVAARRHRVPVLPALYRRLVAPFLSERSRYGLRRLAGRPAEAAQPEWLHPELARRLREGQEPEPSPERDPLEAARRRTYELLVERRPFTQSLAWHEQRAVRLGVEVRHPFLDRRLVEWVLTLPPTLLYRPGRPKALLREAVAGVLPAAVRGRRTKTRLGSFVGHSLFGSQAGWCEELLAEPLAERLGFVDGARLRSAYRAQREAGSVVIYSMYCAIMLEAWLRWQAGRPVVTGEVAAAA